jgi:two-component system LytT family response regulator
MSAIRTLIVDDEPLCRRGVRQMLAGDADFDIVGECANGDEAVEAIGRLRPDVVFLDIKMPRGGGFDVVRRIPLDRMPLVVFVTAFDQYAVDAFKVHAVDYVLKPFTRSRFRAAVEHVKARCRDRRASSIALAMMRMIDGWKDPAAEAECDATSAEGRYLNHLKVGTRGDERWVLVRDIEWIEGADYYVHLHTSARSCLQRERLKNVERQLPPSRFVRVHKSAIVNVDCVERLVSDAHHREHVEMRCGATVPVSRARRAGLLVLLEMRAGGGARRRG